MHLLRDTSISRKLKAVILMTTSIALLLASAAFVGYDRIVFRQSMASDLSTLAKVIGTNSTAALIFDDHDSAKDVLSALTAKQNIVRARIYTSDADLFAEYVRNGESGDVALTVQQQSQVAFTDEYLIASETIDLDGETIGTVYLISNLDALRSRLNRYAGVVAAVLFGSLLVAFLLSSKLQSLISNPISHLAKTARAVSADKDYTIRAVKHGRDEMGVLIDGFNEMLSQIQERDVKLQSARDELERRVEERTKELQDEISERERIEQVLRRSEEHFRSLIENASDVITIIDRKGTVLYESPSVERVLGLRPQTLVGANALDLTHPDDRKSAIALLAAAIGQDGPAGPFELRFQHADGSWRTLEVIGQVVRDEAGAVQVIINSRDITERKKAESELRRSEGYRGTVWEGSLDGMRLTDAGGNVVLVNDAYCRLMEKPREALEGRLLSEAYHEEGRDRIVEKHHEGFRNRSVLPHREKEVVLWNGKRLVLELSNSYLSPNEDSSLLLSVFRDITERRRGEEELRESQERYKILFESAPDGIMIFEAEGDHSGRIVAANPAAAENTGYSVEELLNLTISDLQPPEHAEITARDRQRIVQGEHITLEILRRRKNGTTFPIEVIEGPLTLGDKRFILSFARDLTQRKQIEKEVIMLAHAVRSIQECISITDNNEVVLFVNDAFLNTYGYERHEVIGNSIFDLVRPRNDVTNSDALPPRALSSRWDGELLNRRKDGTEFPVHLSASPIHDGTGQAIALVGVAQDITDRKRAIEELKKAKEAAESASRAKSEFLANMSHEIRTPMNGIIGMTELALDTDLTAEQQEYLKLVKLSADSLLGVINDILDFSKIEAGKLDLDPDEFNLVNGVDDVMKTLGMRAEQKGLELAYYLRPGVPELLVGDLGRLRQILVNLIGNAIKFTDRGEVIVRLDVESQTDQEVVLHFGIRDTGIGVPHAKQKMIFESFTQADGSTTRKHGGTGLGLAISAKLVHLMGGQIWVESPVDIPGRETPYGSMFHFTARFGIPRSPAHIALQHEQLALVGLPVLVVDDNATNRRILEVQLANWQMRPTAVEGAKSALNALRQAEASGTPFKLALLDFHMPGIDGLALAEQIRALPAGGDIRIILMSSSVHQNHSRHRTFGIDASLVKPVKAAELLSEMTAVLSTNARSQAPAHRAASKTETPLRVLVAEDSQVNQELIKRLLEKWGHTPVIAEDGRKALALLDAGKFDLVLMDLQMPEINGFEATAAIRQKERGADAHIPIIALTAHALKGDRERCLEAGMDDYLSKPIESQKLFDVVESIARKSERVTGNGRPHIRALDIDALMKSFDGDRELLLELSKVFADSSPRQLSELYEAVALGDAPGLARGAHTVKGSVANFRARAAVDAAARLEHLARTGDLSIADSALAVLKDEIEKVREELETFAEVS